MAKQVRILLAIPMCFAACLTSELDSDGDLLPDSREEEIGTDPFHHDSDLDGMSDWEEVNRNRDPLDPTDADPLVPPGDDGGPIDGGDSGDGGAGDGDGVDGGDEPVVFGACEAVPPAVAPKAPGTPCEENGGSVCNGEGDCVECVDDGQCVGFDTCNVASWTCGCVPLDCNELGLSCGSGSDGCGGGLNCDNSIKDLDETAVDCGGNTATCGARCGNGRACSVNGDCTSGQCADGVCCDRACDGVCESCIASKSGGTNGVCAPVPNGDDPDGECGGVSCDGAGSCACPPGRSNCDGDATTGLAGCECNTPDCCGNSCQVEHYTGHPFDDLGNNRNASFYDCTPQGTYTLDLALLACETFTGDVNVCGEGDCGGDLTERVVCGDDVGAGDCTCWTYTGPNAGVSFNDPESNLCYCAFPGPQTWY